MGIFGPLAGGEQVAPAHVVEDDAIDLDGSTAALIEQCELVDNGDAGIEIRLHPHAGPDTLDIVVRDNFIAGNGEDGIQLIGYDEETARRFLFEGNRIVGNAMAGIGLMSGANTREDYEAAALPERIVIVHNTFVDNDHHITGGARALVANNLFVGAHQVALKGQVGMFLVRRNLLWGNRAEAEGVAQLQDVLRASPGFAGVCHGLRTGSAAIDAGLMRDLYVALGEPLGGDAWAVRIYYKPMVRWIWLGALIMALGGALALTDARYRKKIGRRDEEPAYE